MSDLFELVRNATGPIPGRPDVFAPAVWRTHNRSQRSQRQIGRSLSPCPKRVAFFAHLDAIREQLDAQDVSSNHS